MSMLSPDVLYGELYRNVQLEHVFADTKTFVDCIPRISVEEILNIYQEQKCLSNFDLSKFVDEYFEIPDFSPINYSSDLKMSTVDHINSLWNILSRPSDQPQIGSSRIPLPYPYIVPGGRFREIFYWDSYFTLLGLSTLPDKFELIQNMIDNFAYLIDTFTFIPNGNRTYFLSRSQPPFFGCMIQLLADLSNNPTDIRTKYLPQLHAEYRFWMMGIDQLTEKNIFNKV
jgi:alpha,alpha-trehalase